jgi:hypothetical protein
MPDFHIAFRDLLRAVNLRHGTDGFTSPPKGRRVEDFLALKIRRLRPGSNPQPWFLKASTLPLDHRSRFLYLRDVRFLNFIRGLLSTRNASCKYEEGFCTKHRIAGTFIVTYHINLTEPSLFDHIYTFVTKYFIFLNLFENKILS